MQAGGPGISHAHYINLVRLREAYRRTRKREASGVDGQSAARVQGAYLEGPAFAHDELQTQRPMLSRELLTCAPCLDPICMTS